MNIEQDIKELAGLETHAPAAGVLFRKSEIRDQRSVVRSQREEGRVGSANHANRRE